MSRLSDLHVSAFVLRVRDGMTEEYKRRHAQIWPEMLAARSDAPNAIWYSAPPVTGR